MPRGVQANHLGYRFESKASDLDREAAAGENALTTEDDYCPRCDAHLWGDEDSEFCVSCGWMQEKNSGEVLEENGYMPKRTFIDCPYVGSDKAYKHVMLHMIIVTGGGGRMNKRYKCPIFISSKHEGRCGRDTKRIQAGKRGFICSLNHQINIFIDGNAWAFMGEKAS